MMPKHFTRTLLSGALIAAAAIAVRLSFAATNTPSQTVSAPSSAAQALAALQATRPAQIVADVSRETGAYTFVRAEGADVLAADNPLASPEERARVFLASNGALVGMNDTERSLIADANRAAAAAATSPAS